MKKIVLLAFVSVLLSTAMVVWFIRPAVAQGTVYIRSNGSVDPLTAPIERNGDVYTLTGNITSDADGIVIERDDMTLDGAGYTVQGIGFGAGIRITRSFGAEGSNVTIKNIEIVAFNLGIRLFCSSNNSIYGNKITDNLYGMEIEEYSNYNNITGNNITNNEEGIRLTDCTMNVLRSNIMVNYRINFGVGGGTLFLNDVDTSNTVDGKPVYYWVNRRDLTVPLNAGYVALVNCTGITLQNLNLTKNSEGILLAYTTNSTIAKNRIANNDSGIFIYNSSNNSISDNDITNNYYGIMLGGYSNHNKISGNNLTANWATGIDFLWSSNNSILGNNITKGWSGIRLDWSSNCNSIVENNITANMGEGIWLHDSSNNSIYHNNFVNNAIQASTNSVNVWDDGYPSGGNYWSNYTGVDANMDGVGDSSYEIDSMNIDHYPLMGMFSDFPATLQEETYHVTAVCNSTISAFEFDQVNRIIRFNVTGETGIGFCRVCIPHNLTEPPYTVTIDGLAPLYVNYTLYDNGTNTWIYFTYLHSEHEVEIIPEFPTWTSMLLILILLTVAIAIYKRRLLKTPIH